MAFLFGSIFFRIGYKKYDENNPNSYQRFIQNMGGALFFACITNFMSTFQAVLLNC